MPRRPRTLSGSRSGTLLPPMSQRRQPKIPLVSGFHPPRARLPPTQFHAGAPPGVRAPPGVLRPWDRLPPTQFHAGAPPLLWLPTTSPVPDRDCPYCQLFCECYVGMASHFDLFRHFFCIRPQMNGEAICDVKGVSLQLRPHSKFFPLPSLGRCGLG